MEIRLFPNSSRPGVGMKPRRESQRPLLPLHARHCPVLEAGSALGFLVYPPLEPNESFHIEYQGDGRYQFLYCLSAAGKWEPIFSVLVVLPLGSIGMFKEEVTFMTRNPPISKEAAVSLARIFIVPEDLGTPPGAISLRGATNFQTPAGWDTVYADLQRDQRQLRCWWSEETDWYARDRVSLRSAGRGYPRSAPDSDRAGVLRTARGDDAARLQRRRDGGNPPGQRGVLPRESRVEGHDSLRTASQPSLSPPEPLNENLIAS